MSIDRTNAGSSEIKFGKAKDFIRKTKHLLHCNLEA